MRENSFWLLRPSQVSKFERTLTGRAGCSKWPSSKAAASEEANRTLFSPGPPITCQNRCYPRPYVELLSDARTPLAGFINSLLSPLASSGLACRRACISNRFHSWFDRLTTNGMERRLCDTAPDPYRLTRKRQRGSGKPQRNRPALNRRARSPAQPIYAGALGQGGTPRRPSSFCAALGRRG